MEQPSPAAPEGAIDLSDEDAVRRWTAHFGITTRQLEEAVHAAGTQAADVQRHLLEQGASSGAG